MRFSSPLVPAIFHARLNRFLGEVLVQEEEVQCFIPNPGRMEELLYPGANIHLLERISETRKTDYNLTLVDLNGTLVSIDSNVPNQIVRESIERGEIEEFKGLTVEKPEYTIDASRIDFLLSGDSDSLLLEVKSCTLVRNNEALFPDAPTKRGSRHLRTLIKWLSRGRSAIFILIQRGDAEKFIPNEKTDPKFSETLRLANREGVEVYAYLSRVTLDGVFLDHRIPVVL